MTVKRTELVLGPHQNKRRPLEGREHRLLVGPVVQGTGLAGKDLRAKGRFHVQQRLRIAAMPGPGER